MMDLVFSESNNAKKNKKINKNNKNKNKSKEAKTRNIFFVHLVERQPKL